MSEDILLDGHFWQYVQRFHRDHIDTLQSVYNVKLKEEICSPEGDLITVTISGGTKSGVSGAKDTLCQLQESLLRQVEREILTLPDDVTPSQMLIIQEVVRGYGKVLASKGELPDTVLFIGEASAVKQAKKEVRKKLSIRPRNVQQAQRLQRLKYRETELKVKPTTHIDRDSRNLIEFEDKVKPSSDMDDLFIDDLPVAHDLVDVPENEEIDQDVLITALAEFGGRKAEQLLTELLDGTKSKTQVAGEFAALQDKRPQRSGVPRSLRSILAKMDSRSSPVDSRLEELKIPRLRKDDMDELFGEEEDQLPNEGGKWISHDEWINIVMATEPLVEHDKQRHTANIVYANPQKQMQERVAKPKTVATKVTKPSSPHDLLFDLPDLESVSRKAPTTFKRRDPVLPQTMQPTKEEKLDTRLMNTQTMTHERNYDTVFNPVTSQMEETMIDLAALDDVSLMEALQNNLITPREFEDEYQRRERQQSQNTERQTDFAGPLESPAGLSFPSDKSSVEKTRRVAVAQDLTSQTAKQLSKQSDSDGSGDTIKDGFGKQPENGVIEFYEDKYNLVGFDDHGTIMIKFYFPKGKQCADDPRPGTRYRSASHILHLPDNQQGRYIRDLVKRAFDKKKLFHIAKDLKKSSYEQVTFNNFSPITRDKYPNVSLQRAIEELETLVSN